MISIDELVQNDHLGLLFKYGKTGGKRLVKWAHVVDLADPWNWIAPGTLVMTTGGGLPSTSSEQVEWIRKLEQAEASAIVIAPTSLAPTISEEMLNEASNLGFPILIANFDLEFLKLARLVIESVLQAQRDRFDLGNKLFRIYTDALWESSNIFERIKFIGKKLSLNLQILDKETSTPIFDFFEKIDNQEISYNVNIPGRTKTTLNIINNKSRFFDEDFLPKILAGLLSIELERAMINRDDIRSEGESLFDDLLNGNMDLSSAKVLLERRGLKGKLVTLAISSEINGPRTFEDLHHIPEFYDIYPLFYSSKNIFYVVIPEDEALFSLFIKYLGKDTMIGISSTIMGIAGFKESIYQASLALSRIKEKESKIIFYNNDGYELAIGPKTVAEARAIVNYYFSSLIEYEQKNKLPLLKTLAVFLESDGNWKTTANKLEIHRQTLVYRLRVIEELTGQKPTSSQGVCNFWIALKAANIVGLL